MSITSTTAPLRLHPQDVGLSLTPKYFRSELLESEEIKQNNELKCGGA
ncbi:hypothetical protein PCA20602_05027 [Pandoraea capi]|uniref:Uncharacterized protein n=1 Tax=Pandoraea capi TaxID=2508286 RepID=A0ABY6WC87_9BURK|nr:hypothetical protein PCA20602_05027 [Pandoraea capi]